MEFEEQKRIFQQQQAGFAILHKLEIEKMREATFADRLAAFRRVLSLSECLPKSGSRTDDNALLQTWIKIRLKYAEKNR